MSSVIAQSTAFAYGMYLSYQAYRLLTPGTAFHNRTHRAAFTSPDTPAGPTKFTLKVLQYNILADVYVDDEHGDCLF
jgi:hypothetical protein